MQRLLRLQFLIFTSLTLSATANEAIAPVNLGLAHKMLLTSHKAANRKSPQSAVYHYCQIVTSQVM